MKTIPRKAATALISLSLLGGMALAGPPAQAGVHVGVVIPVGPPEPRAEPVPPPPRHYRADHVVWQPGHWRWNGRDYVWVSGRYVEIPRHRHGWDAGHWERRPGGWVWFDGRWR